MTTIALNTTIPKYINDSLDILQARLGHPTRSATVSYLLELSLLYEVGEDAVDKLYDRMVDDDQRRRDKLCYTSNLDSNLYHQAKLIASAPNMANDIEGIYQALKAGESLEGFQLIG